MTIPDLVRGPNQTGGPSADGRWMVIQGKTEGITPGFWIEDERGDIYVIKFDPPENPEMATAAEIISTKFFYAMGYHVPENYLIDLDPERLDVSPDAIFEQAMGRTRPMTDADLEDILTRTDRSEEGTHRVVASKFLDGAPLGPFQYYGSRPDDPNDIFLHENRRELRGLRILAAWLNHDDSRAINSQDMLITEGDSSYVRHHLIDFGSSLGSGSVGLQKHRAGWEYMWEPKAALGRILTLGLWDRQWIRIRYPDLPSIGRLESEYFQPEEWKPEYPNPAFRRATPEDTYWGTRIVMSFSDDEIRAIVGAGRLSNPEAEDYLVEQLIRRRDAIGRYGLGLVNTADEFEVTGEATLRFEHLASVYGVSPIPADTGATWSRFDNITEQSTALGSEAPYNLAPLELPAAIVESQDGDYFQLRLREEDKIVDVFLGNRGGELEVIGIERP